MRAWWMLAIAMTFAGASQATQATSPASWAWTPASGSPERYDVLVDRGAGWTLERSVAATTVSLEGQPGATIRVKVRGVRGLEVGPESPESVLVAWVAPPATKRRVWVQRLSRARCEELKAPGWVPYHAAVEGQPGQAEIGCEGSP